MCYTCCRQIERYKLSHLRKLEKLHIKWNKLQLNINFLIKCKIFGIFPKFIHLNIWNINECDTSC